MSIPSSPEISLAAQADEHEYHELRERAKAEVLEKTGFSIRDFQLDAVLAILSGQDVVVHAGTGAGKTLIFAAPHFVQPNKVSIVISPLILLQQDQRERMKKLDLTAIAINKEVHLEPEDWDDLANGKYQIVLLSPEMALHSEQVHKVFDSKPFRERLIAINIDEAHTISLWGGDFRKDYRGLGRIRARLPKGVPVSLVSATLQPKVKQDALSTLGFSANPTDYVDINVGNERTNVFMGACPMKHPSSSFRDLSVLFPPDATEPEHIPKAIVYIDDVQSVTSAVIQLYAMLPPSLQHLGLIRPVHSWMPASYRSDAMARFASGEVRILVCTEAAGMGCDISDIVMVIQYGLCKSLDALIQRFGRVARSPDATGEGWLIFEPWVINGTGGNAGNASRKACDQLLRALVNEPACRRQYANQVYSNPETTVPIPPEKCCDKCSLGAVEAFNGKCHTFGSAKPAPRADAVSGDSSPEMLACLEAWREATFESVFGVDSLFGIDALISDPELQRLARCSPIASIDKLRRYLLKWPRVDSLLDSMWEALEQGGFTTSPVNDSQPAPPPSNTQNKATHKRARKPAALELIPSGNNAIDAPGRPLVVPSQGSRSSRQPTVAPNSNPQLGAQSSASWIRAYMGECSYEVRETSLEDLERMFARQAEERAAKEASKARPPPTPSDPNPKRHHTCPPIQRTRPRPAYRPLLCEPSPMRKPLPLALFAQHLGLVPGKLPTTSVPLRPPPPKPSDLPALLGYIDDLRVYID